METRGSNISDILRDVAQQVSPVSTGPECVCYRRFMSLWSPIAKKKKKTAQAGVNDQTHSGVFTQHQLVQLCCLNTTSTCYREYLHPMTVSNCKILVNCVSQGSLYLVRILKVSKEEYIQFSPDIRQIEHFLGKLTETFIRMHWHLVANQGHVDTSHCDIDGNPCRN